MTLKSLRAENGLSQNRLADATGINAKRISEWETGARAVENMSLATAVRLADALGGADLRDLLDD